MMGRIIQYFPPRKLFDYYKRKKKGFIDPRNPNNYFQDALSKVSHNITNLDHYYVLQHQLWGIGNFIMCTPTLETLSDHFNRPVPVYFELPHIAEMFLDCPFIEIINRKQAKQRDVLFSSAMVNEEMEDWKYIHQLVTGHLDIQVDTIPHTYVDMCKKPSEIEQKYCVIIRGGVNNSWFSDKEPGNEIYKYIIEKVSPERNVVFIGGSSDYERFICEMKGWIPRSIVILDNIRGSLGAMAYADFVVTNDTGMYHAAGALNKDIFVLWKHTNFIKNRSPGENCRFSFIGDWESDFNEWYYERESKSYEMSGHRI